MTKLVLKAKSACWNKGCALWCFAVDPSIVKGDLDRTASGSQATECLEDPIDTSMDLTDGVTFCLANTPVLNGREISQVDKTSDDLTMGYSKVWEKGSHPTWGSGVPGELSGFHTGMNSSSVLPALQAQRQRWGAVPGQDDTLNIDLEGNGISFPLFVALGLMLTI